MNTPDPMKQIFARYTGEITATSTGDADRLWRRAKRRRIGQVAAAGVAALALTGSATWAFQQNVAPEEQETAAEETPEPTVPDETSTPTEEQEDYLDMLGPGADLVGAELDLPPFVPGDAEIDAVCGLDGVVLGDGRHEEPVEHGSVFLKEALPGTLAGDGGGWAEVGLFGCRYGEETLYQAVVLEEVQDDTWAAREQIVHSVPGGESPQYLQSTDDDGVLIGFAERYDPAANDLAYWVESVGFDAAGAPVREVLAELDEAGYSDLSVQITATETEEAGIWTVTLEVRNNGPRDISDHVLNAGADEEIEVVSGEPLGNIEEGIWTTLGELDDFGVGQSYSQEWTVSVDADRDDDGISPRFDVGLEATEPWEERPELVQTVFWGQEGGVYYFYQ
ncbi:hypothetical protein O1R50_22545 [Glycomyces luteolus]|uniref:Uncharacterized protein n=1 Tax=Glycomyces luteolus TaxID=2670330 RepID=A0A9X3PBR2_9ACTN|nr:hypothetical protein [Glycomyces luteolus]MDA1362421.1 hypothetical protein [Glycomyces luteolus]